MEITFDIKLTKKQEEAYNIMHDYSTRLLACCYSRQSGKTVLAEILLIENLLKNQKYSAYISPTYAQGKKVFNEIVALLEPTKLIKKANAAELYIESVTNSKLQFFSMQSPTSIRGTTVSGLLVLDEAAYFPKILPNGENPWFNVIFPIIKAQNPQVLVISTPNGKQGFFYDLYTQTLSGKKAGYRALTATIYDDELISAEQIEEIKKGYPEIAFAQEFECKFLDNALTVFRGFDGCYNESVKLNYNRLWCGIDLSGEGSDETILTFIGQNNCVEQHKIEGTLDAKYQEISRLLNEKKPIGTYIEINGVGMPMFNEIKKLTKIPNVLPFTTTNETKKNYVGALSIEFVNKNIRFNDKELYAELAVFTYKLSKSGNIIYGAKSGEHDDRVISLALALKAKQDLTSKFTESTYFYKPNIHLLK